MQQYAADELDSVFGRQHKALSWGAGRFNQWKDSKFMQYRIL